MRVVLYTTLDPCPLCVDGWLAVDALAARVGFVFEEVAVETDPDLASRLRARVPVLEIDGREVGCGRFDPVVLEGALRRARVAGSA